MKRNIHLAGVICYSITLAFVCFWTFQSLTEGVEFNEFVSFPNLVVADWIVLIACEVVFLLYFHLKGYKVAFVTSMVSAITFMILYTLVYNFFINGVGDGDFINGAITIHLIAVIIWSLSLVFSKASERPLLKKAGYVSIVFGLIILGSHIAGLNTPEGEALNVWMGINLWFGRIGGLIAIFYVLNFYQEMRSAGNPSSHI